MAKTMVTITDAGGVVRTVPAIDAREIAAIVEAENAVDESKAEVPKAEAPKAMEASETEAPTTENPDENTAFPKNFPGAAVFVKEGIGYHRSLRMTRDELIAVKGIGEKLADEILRHRT